jgi:hypothetical protein
MKGTIQPTGLCSTAATAAWLGVAGFASPLFGQSTNSALPLLAPAYPEIPPTFWELHAAAILVSGSALLAAAIGYVLLRLRPEPPVAAPPEIRAHASLIDLQREPEEGKVLSEISQVLRRYASEAFDLPAGEQTTAELSAALAGSARIDPELARAVGDFLRGCDTRKFSPAGSPAPLNAATRALELVAQMEKQRMKFIINNHD